MKSSPLITFHLACYNQMQGSGWLFTLCWLLAYGFTGAWSSLYRLLIGLQCLVWLDLVHAFAGLWPPVPQLGIWQRLWCKVGHRSEIFISIALADASVLDSWAFGFLVFTWSLADISRFQLYFLRSLDRTVPHWLRWMRYSDFIVQYPLVVVSEAWFVALVHLSHSQSVMMFWSAAVVISVAIMLPEQLTDDIYKFAASVRWVVVGLIALVAVAGYLGFGVVNPSYAPLALFFQVYEWVICVPAFRTLWGIRQQRLVKPITVEALGTMCAMGMQSDKVLTAPQLVSQESKREPLSNTEARLMDDNKTSVQMSDIDFGPAGSEADAIVIEHWKRMWLETCAEEASLRDDFDTRTQTFIDNARKHLDFQTFVAFDRPLGEIVASVSCQRWTGPMPLVVKESAQKFGSVWAVYVRPSHRRMGVARRLMEMVKDHWRRIGCKAGLLLHASESGRRVYSRVGFAPGNMLLLDLPVALRKDPPPAETQCKVETVDALADATVVDKWRQMWIDCGVAHDELQPELTAITHQFLSGEAHEVQAFVVRATEAKGTVQVGDVIGSVVSNVWRGPLPLVLRDEVFKIGTLWGLHVHPEYRRHGVGLLLVEHCIARWHSIACLRGIVLLPRGSSSSRGLFDKLGFASSNAMVIDLATKSEHDEKMMEMVQALRNMGVAGTDTRLCLMLRALPQQLEAAFAYDTAEQQRQDGLQLCERVLSVQREFGTFIDPADNWFTRNLHRMGGNFDMAKLAAEPGRLAAKFDKLSGRYDVWTVGNQSRVEHWVSGQARLHKDTLGGQHARILDVACGIGLMSHQLRLCGYEGHFTGTDISPGMVAQSRARGVFDEAFVCDLHHGLPTTAQSLDLVICTGAMELLDQGRVLADFCRVLKPGGQLWVSFQAELHSASADSIHPTAHQNVKGVTRDELLAKLETAGFDAAEVEVCDAAFLTPSPNKDGTLLPVPYFFVCASQQNSDA